MRESKPASVSRSVVVSWESRAGAEQEIMVSLDRYHVGIVVGLQRVLRPFEHILRDQQRRRKHRPEIELSARLLICLSADVVITSLAGLRPNKEVRISPAAGLAPLPNRRDSVCAPRQMIPA